MRKYPIGIQDFRKIREGGFIYVDKTRLIHTLIESGDYYFLSRPRRFGKSLLLSTITEIFNGSRELFKGLWIEGNWNWEQRNPVIHLAFSAFQNFWFQTGTPTFLIDQIKKRGEFQYEGIRLGEITLGSFNIENFTPASLLFQTGYLTIKKYDPASKIFELSFPNNEVETSFLDSLLSSYREVFPGDSLAWSTDLKEALRTDDIPRLIELLDALIITIPYDHWQTAKESLFHTIIYLAFKIVGIDVQTEVHNAKGRCDVLVQTATHIYVIEFKLNSSAKKAVEQIVKKDYLKPFTIDKREKVAIGINFSSKDRKVKDYLVKDVHLTTQP